MSAMGRSSLGVQSPPPSHLSLKIKIHRVNTNSPRGRLFSFTLKVSLSIGTEKPVLDDRPVHLQCRRPADLLAFITASGFIVNGYFFDLQALFQEFDRHLCFKGKVLRGDGDPLKCATGKNFL